jgi:hypothetical protein
MSKAVLQALCKGGHLVLPKPTKTLLKKVFRAFKNFTYFFEIKILGVLGDFPEKVP